VLGTVICSFSPSHAEQITTLRMVKERTKESWLFFIFVSTNS